MSTSRLPSLIAISRAGDWWEHKLLPALAVLYGAALFHGLHAGQWLVLQLKLLGLLVPGAVFVSVINDLADRRDDARAGKANRLASAGLAVRAAALVIPVTVGLAWCCWWSDTPVLVVLYVAAWLAFAAYSLPPLRLKGRGWAGAVADAAGAHLFPSLIALTMVVEAAARAVPLFEAVLIACWAFCTGLRGALWHQLCDRDGDRRAGVSTLAVRTDPETLKKLTRVLYFPLELLSLAGLLTMLTSTAAWAALVFYAITAWQRLRIWRMRAILVAPADRAHIVLDDYYAILLPLALLGAALAVDPAGALPVAGAHLILFHRPIRRSIAGYLRIERSQILELLDLASALRKRLPVTRRRELQRIDDVSAKR